MSRRATARRSGFLLIEEEREQDGHEPFRYSYTMNFPPKEQKALLLLAKLLFFREDFEVKHFPLYRRSNNLAHLHAAGQDILSVAKSLAAVAVDMEEELPLRDSRAARMADVYAVKAARLAAEIAKAIEEVAPAPKRGTS